MPGLLDLPLEIRLKILAYLLDYLGISHSPPYWRVIGVHPPISLVNHQLRHESLDAFYRYYKWSLGIIIAQDGNAASATPEVIRCFQAMQRADQLWRLQRIGIVFILPQITSFSAIDLEQELQPFDAQYPDRPSFYKSLGNILRRATKLRRIEITWFGSDSEDVLSAHLRACQQLTTFLPRTCEYKIRPFGYNSYSPRLKRYIDGIQEEMTKNAEA